MPTKYFTELVLNATNDYNNDPQFKERIRRKISHPIFGIIVSHLANEEEAIHITVHCIIGGRVCELIGELGDATFVQFICRYLIELEDAGLIQFSSGKI